MSIVTNQTQLEALARLLEIAQRDTGQSRRVANFLLAWHNAEENGGWDPYDLSNLDTSIFEDILSVLVFVRAGKYPGDLGFKREIEYVWRLWRGRSVTTTSEGRDE